MAGFEITKKFKRLSNGNLYFDVEFRHYLVTLITSDDIIKTKDKRCFAAIKEKAMCALFVEALMDHIMEGVMIPKVQIERAVGPILSMFLADVLTETLRDDPALSGSIVMICPEFPLKKADNRQSTNIDWLMYNKERKQLLFVELKTSDTSFDSGQNIIYRAKQDAVRSEGGSFLMEDLEQMTNASTEAGKYRYILEKRLSLFKTEITACRDAKIIYLIPKSAQHKVRGLADKVFSFGMLSNSITGSFAEEWNVIQNHLCMLDDSSRRSRNQQLPSVPVENRVANFVDSIDFLSIVEMCKKLGDAVIVGFTGGVAALVRKDLASLEHRKYKWDNVVGGIGNKVLRNWIPGSVFSDIISKKKTHPRESLHQNPAPKRAKYWEGTLKFDGMFNLCQKHGDDILIGFTGGREEFKRKTLSDLQKRSSYKWDFAKNTTGKKLADWLPGASVIAMLKTHHGYSSNGM